MKTAKVIWIACAALSFPAAAASAWWWLHSPIPAVSGIQEIPRLKRPVVVQFDDHRVPYIEASCASDMFLAQGYVVASERMLQMDLLRRKANGQLAEVFGAGCLASDRFMRTLGLRRTAELELAFLSPDAKQALEAYTMGVNAYLSQYSSRLPLEFTALGYSPRPWSSVDSLAIMKLVSYEQSESWKLDDLRQRVKDRFATDRVNDAAPLRAGAGEETADSQATGGEGIITATSSGTAGGGPLSAGNITAAGRSSKDGQGSGAPNKPTRVASWIFDDLFRTTWVVPLSPRPSPDQPTSPAQPGQQPPQKTSRATGNSVHSRIRASNWDSVSGAPTGSAGFQPASTGRSALEKPPGRRRSQRFSSPGANGIGGAGASSHTIYHSVDGDGRSPDIKHGAVETLHSLLAEARRMSSESGSYTGASFSVGSTAAVVAPARSTTGGALLSGDKHENFSLPALWYACSLSAPGFHAAGATIPGVPAVVIGRNEHIGWTSAALKADVQDIFVEHFTSEFGRQVLGPDGPEPVQERTELISVRWVGDIEHKVLATERGPLLARDGTAGISLAWTGNNPGKPALNTYIELNTAVSWEDFTFALEKLNDPPMLFLFADRSGNTGAHAAGEIPVRKEGGDGTLVQDAQAGKGAWTGSVPFARLPRLTQPYNEAPSRGRGVIVAANQMIPLSAIGTPVAKEKVFLGKQWNAPYRANRLLALLGAPARTPPPLSLAALNAAAGDQEAPLLDLVRKSLTEAAFNQNSNDALVVPAVKALAAWDGQLRQQSVPAALYEGFLIEVSRSIIEAKLGDELSDQYLDYWPMWLTFIEHCLKERPERWLPPAYRNYDAFFLGCLTEAARQFRVELLGKPAHEWTWGSVHRISFRNPAAEHAGWLGPLLNIENVPAGGETETLFSSGGTPRDGRLSFAGRTGSAHRLLIDMADNDRLYQVIAPGQSGHRFSRARADQLTVWLDRDVLPLAFSRAQLSKQMKHKLILQGIE